VRQKVAPKVFRRILSNRLGFLHKILQIYFPKCCTFNCQAKWDSVKNDEVIDFNMTAYRFKNVQATAPIQFIVEKHS